MRYLPFAALLLGAACGRTEVGDGLGHGDGPEPGADVAQPGCEDALRVSRRLTLAGGGANEAAIPYGGGFIHGQREGSRALLVRRDLASEQTLVAAQRGGDFRLLDADSSRALFVHAEDGRASLMLERSGELRLLYDGAPPQLGLGGMPRRQFDGMRVAYCGPDGWSIHVEDLSNARPSFGSLVQDGIRCQEPLFLEGSHLVHLGHDARGRTVIVQYAFASGALPRVVASGAELSMPALWKGRLYYLRDGYLVRQPLEPDAPWETLSEDRCASLDPGPSGVIAACGAEQGAWPYGAGKYLLHYDGERAQPLEFPGLAPATVMLPRIDGGLVAWLSYDDPNDLCVGSGDRPAGRVMVAALPGGPALAAAQIYAGCFCCGAYWPNPLLDLREDTIVFNYDAAAGGVMSREGGLGAALVERGCEP